MKESFKRQFARLTLCLSVALPVGQAAAAMAPLAAIGKGEGTLNVVAWEGYAQDDWVKPFEAATGCQVHAKYAGSSDEMVALMRSGGGNQYDIVSASGDATLRLIYGHNVQPINLALIPGLEEFIPAIAGAGFQHRQRHTLRCVPTNGAPTPCSTAPKPFPPPQPPGA